MRFRIRTLLICVTVAALAMCPLGWRLSVVRRQQIAIERLRSLGATIGYADDWDKVSRKPKALANTDYFSSWSSRAEYVALAGLQNPKGVSRVLKDMVYVTDLAIFDSKLGLGMIESICSMPRLQRLTLSDTTLDDKLLMQLADIDSLQYLNGMGTDITAHGIRAFRERRPDCKISVTFDAEFILHYQRLIGYREALGERGADP